ncbi:MAG: helix-turn-helix domain-containing protein [Bacteroidaceae bacterium]|nr:helix-turn-helix domain-containing protein [Bacteroidaceae bacterium]
MDLSFLSLQTIAIAKKGGKLLREASCSFDASWVEEKHSHDYVSRVDRECEQFLVKELHQLLPEAGFITEEATPTPTGHSSYTWVIDPLDGTTNFIRNIAPYCISIALRTEKEILIGVVYEVCRDECFSAYKGAPAMLNGHPIEVSQVETMQHAYAQLELPYNVLDYYHTGGHMYDVMYHNVACIRMMGSAAADMCYVAAGRFDIWFEAFIKQWDFSAAALIVEQAGGMVTDFLGNPIQPDTHHIVATNGHLHSTILTELQKALPTGIHRLNKSLSSPSYITRLSPKKAEHIYTMINQEIVIKERYLDPHFTATLLAKDLKITSKYISAIMSLRYHASFNTFVNKLRIQRVLYMLKDKRYNEIPTATIGMMCGFANKQTYYTAFSEYVGTTPANYRKNIKTQSK